MASFGAAAVGVAVMSPTASAQEQPALSNFAAVPPPSGGAGLAPLPQASGGASVVLLAGTIAFALGTRRLLRREARA